ncbi:MAG: sigma factor-like helix-turn-helix DNA-binding protein [Acidithiobacillus sp.]
MENKMVASESPCSSTAQSENLAIKEVVDELFHGLSKDEIQILLVRFGIGEPAGQSVDELAQRLHITTEQVLATEATTLRKLRHPSRSERLRMFVDGLKTAGSVDTAEKPANL